MNLNKSLEFFNPDELLTSVHIIGCGAVGSTIAENLTRLGIKKLHLWDFDIVCEHNIANQIFLSSQINTPKIDALAEILQKINPDIQLVLHTEGWQPNLTTPLTGYVFLCVDSIETRKQILKENYNNTFIEAFFDNRMRLTDAQHYASSWKSPTQKDTLLASMEFTDEEAKNSTPTSACGTTLSVCYTVRTLAAIAVANFINKIQTQQLDKTILINFKPISIESFKE